MTALIMFPVCLCCALGVFCGSNSLLFLQDIWGQECLNIIFGHNCDRGFYCSFPIQAFALCYLLLSFACVNVTYQNCLPSSPSPCFTLFFLFLFSSPNAQTQQHVPCTGSCSSLCSLLQAHSCLDLMYSSRTDTEWGEGEDKALQYIMIRTAAFLLQDNLKTCFVWTNRFCHTTSLKQGKRGKNRLLLRPLSNHVCTF